MKQTKRRGFALRAACVLLCLVLISVHFSSGLYAKMITGAADGDSARTAGFRVSAELIPAEAGAYTIALHNDSESAVRYSVTFRAKIPGSFSQVRLGDGAPAAPDADGAVTFPNAGALAAGADGTLTLIPTAVPGAGAEAGEALLDFSNESIAAAEQTLPFTVTVQCEQIS